MPENGIPMTELSVIRILSSHLTCSTSFWSSLGLDRAVGETQPNQLADHVKPKHLCDSVPIVFLKMFYGKHPSLFILKMLEGGCASRETILKKDLYQFIIYIYIYIYETRFGIKYPTRVYIPLKKIANQINNIKLVNKNRTCFASEFYLIIFLFITFFSSVFSISFCRVENITISLSLTLSLSLSLSLECRLGSGILPNFILGEHAKPLSYIFLSLFVLFVCSSCCCLVSA